MTKCLAIAAMLFVAGTNVQAQGFLKKLSKAASTVTDKAKSVTEGTSESSDSVKALKWDAIPKYEVKEVVAKNSDGSIAKNEDGTPMKSYQLVDQFGNVRSAAAVKAQQKKINKAIGNILLKVGAGAAVGVAGGLLASKGKAAAGIAGGVAGAAAGLALSAKDIKQAKALKASMKEQEELLAKYEKTFTAEGQPVAADASTMADVESMAKGELALTAENYKQTLNSPEYKDASNWDVPTI
jgi:outer membrane lipoprotein SlyB